MPFVMLGDFNVDYGTPAYTQLLELFPDCADADCGGTHTYNERTNPLISFWEPDQEARQDKIDYIFYSRDHWSVKEMKVLTGPDRPMFQPVDDETDPNVAVWAAGTAEKKAPLSDHDMVVVKLRLVDSAF